MEDFILLGIFFFILCLLIWSISTLVGLIRAKGVPFVPLKRRQLRNLEKYIKLEASDQVVDLGCGDGRVLRLLEKQKPLLLHGYEVNFWAFARAYLNNILKRSKSQVYFKNFNKCY